MQKIYNWLNIIQHYALTPTCIICGAHSKQSIDLCQSCYCLFPINTHSCRQCALPLVSSTSQYCAQCLHTPHVFDRTLAPFCYQTPISQLITGLKFHRQYKNARILGELLSNQVQQEIMPECLIPVPLHPKRYRWRGFNHAIEIAKTVSKRLRIPIDVSSCIRQYEGHPQVNLNAQQRKQGISNAFCVRRAISAQYVALIDDVMTTGATVDTLALALKQSGVKRVDVWVCARTVII